MSIVGDGGFQHEPQKKPPPIRRAGFLVAVRTFCSRTAPSLKRVVPAKVTALSGRTKFSPPRAHTLAHPLAEPRIAPASRHPHPPCALIISTIKPFTTFSVPRFVRSSFWRREACFFHSPFLHSRSLLIVSFPEPSAKSVPLLASLNSRADLRCSSSRDMHR
jgi:hypothetical protein